MIVAQGRRRRAAGPPAVHDPEEHARIARQEAEHNAFLEMRRQLRRRSRVEAEVVVAEPMPMARVPADPLVFAIKQRLESLEADMGLVHETIAAIGDAARVSLLEDVNDGGDDPGINSEPQRGGAVSRPIGQEIRRHDVRDVAIKGRRS
jgi:hypothetical protein